MKRVVSVVLAALIAASAVEAGSCSSDRFRIQGIVIDSIGKPVTEARVYILLDEISEKRFIEQGWRAVSFRVDERGEFVASIDCAAAREGESSGRPNPCAKKPRHVTVAVGGNGYKLRLAVHRIKDLTIVETQGICSIALPQVRLVPGA